MVISTFHGFDSPVLAAEHAKSLGMDFAFPRDPLSVTEGGPLSAGDPKSRSVTVVTSLGTSVVYEVQLQNDGSWMVFRATRNCAAATVTTSGPPEVARPALPCVAGTANAPRNAPGFPSPVDAVKGWWDAGHYQPPGTYLDPRPVPGRPREQIVRVQGSTDPTTASYEVTQKGDGSWHVNHATVVCTAR